MVHLETHSRSFAKALSWRLSASCVTFAISYFYTGKVAESLQVTITIAFLSTIAYYFHERLWNEIHWGKKHIDHKKSRS